MLQALGAVSPGESFYSMGTAWLSMTQLCWTQCIVGCNSDHQFHANCTQNGVSKSALLDSYMAILPHVRMPGRSCRNNAVYDVGLPAWLLAVLCPAPQQMASTIVLPL